MNNSSSSGSVPFFKNITKDQICKALISIFIGLQVVTTIAWLSPESAFRDLIVDNTRLPWEFFALRQRWSLFAPEIRHQNFQPLGYLAFEDGTSTVWEVPYTQFKNQFEKFSKDRFHKWSVDALAQPVYEPYWPDFARYAGKLHYDPQNKPSTFMLMVFSGEIPSPQSGVSRFNMPPLNKCKTVFTYRYRPEDFR